MKLTDEWWMGLTFLSVHSYIRVYWRGSSSQQIFVTFFSFHFHVIKLSWLRLFTRTQNFHPPTLSFKYNKKKYSIINLLSWVPCQCLKIALTKDQRKKLQNKQKLHWNIVFFMGSCLKGHLMEWILELLWLEIIKISFIMFSVLK